MTKRKIPFSGCFYLPLSSDRDANIQGMVKNISWKTAQKSPQINLLLVKQSGAAIMLSRVLTQHKPRTTKFRAASLVKLMALMGRK